MYELQSAGQHGRASAATCLLLALSIESSFSSSVTRSLTIARLASGGLITNYYCSSRCRHCLYRSGPEWPKDYIDRENTRCNLVAVRRLGCASVHIGGGEPMLAPEKLESVLDTAQEVGVGVEYVETNSSFYQDHAQACRVLGSLREHGLQCLLVSMSPLHNEFVPFAKVKGVLTACREVGVTVFPWVQDFVPDLTRLDQTRTHSLEEAEAILGSGYLETLPSRYWISWGGRALDTFARSVRQRSLDELLEGGGCDELARSGHFHVDLYGNYIPGLCAGFSVRREDLGTTLSDADYPIITEAYRRGVAGLFRYATELGFSPARTSYAAKCELCYELRRFLVVERGARSHELEPRHHYLL
jgi:hypothetical protein